MAPANKPEVQQLGTNVRVMVEGDETVIRIKHNERHGPSGTGKTIIVASTSGNKEIPGTNGVIIGINAYVKP